MKNLLFFLVFIMVFTVHSRAAENEPDTLLVTKVLKQLRIPLSNTKQEFIRTKQMPNDRAKTIVTIPVMQNEDADGYSYTMDAYILLVSSGSGKVLQKYYEEGYWESDALRLEDIGIDTAPYRLNSETRAFGIGTSYTGSSQPNPYSEQTISLFVVIGNTLVKVLDKLVLERNTGEWDMRCAGVFQNLKRTISVAPNKTKGYADLIINSRTVSTESFPKGEECEEKVLSNKLEKSILKFNGEIYPSSLDQ